DNFLLFRGQRDRRVPHDGLLTVEGLQDASTYQSTNLPILSTLYQPLSKQLISVLGVLLFWILLGLQRGRTAWIGVVAGSTPPVIAGRHIATATRPAFATVLSVSAS